MTVVAATMSAISSPTPAATPTNIPTLAPTPTLTPEPTTLRVVYSRAGEIWIWNQGGQPLKLSNTGIDVQPRISSDGKIVVFARNNELYAINPDGSGLRKIVSKEYLSEYRPANHKWIWADCYEWMLDTHILYFTTMIQLADEGVPLYQFDLHRVNVDTGEVSIVLSAGEGGIPYFSPNGQSLAVARPDSISIANVDGSDWRNALSFEQVVGSDNWTFIPVLVPLPDGSGFRLVVPAHDSLSDPDELSEFWHIPLHEESELLYTFQIASGIPYKTLSPSGNSIVFSKRDPNGSYILCVYHYDTVQETCVPKPGPEELFTSNWALDDSKYNFETLGWVLDNNGSSVYDATYYISAVARPNEAPVEIDAYVWLAWVNPDQYLYIDEEWNLQLATFGGSTNLIHNGVKNQTSIDGMLPFDFSTR